MRALLVLRKRKREQRHTRNGRYLEGVESLFPQKRLVDLADNTVGRQRRHNLERGTPRTRLNARARGRSRGDPLATGGVVEHAKVWVAVAPTAA